MNLTHAADLALFRRQSGFLQRAMMSASTLIEGCPQSPHRIWSPSIKSGLSKLLSVLLIGSFDVGMVLNLLADRSRLITVVKEEMHGFVSKWEPILQFALSQ